MNYKDYGISETLTEKVKNAMVEQYAHEVEEAKTKVIEHFVSKGYTKNEIELQMEIRPSLFGDNRTAIEVTARVPGNLNFSEFVKDLKDQTTVSIDGFAPNVKNTKKLNEALLEVQEVCNKWIEDKVQDAESKFMELKELPDYFISSIHGVELQMSVIVIKVSGRTINPSERMKEHYLQLKKVKDEKDAAEKAQKAAAEKAARETLRTWAIENGSDLLKLRIKHEQNWMQLAQTEWAIAHSAGFDVWDYTDNDDSWPVNNATIDQLKAMEAAEAENPDHNIEIHRYKWVEDYDEVTHRTFLTCDAKTPTGNITLYKEIDDVSSEDDE
jgi:hypothetical protein